MHRFDNPTSVSWMDTVHGLLQAAKTVVFVPEHDKHIIHPTVAEMLRHDHLPLHKPIATQESKLAALGGLKPITVGILSQKELVGLTAVLAQFTLYLPSMRPYWRIDYASVKQLHDAVIKYAVKNGPVGLIDQLKIALDIRQGNTEEAMWLLLVTSRQYARWYDSDAAIGLPTLTHDTILDEMTGWSRSIKSFKNTSVQDTAGDTYYCWTHAFAWIAFKTMAKRQTLFSRLQFLALRYGTELNHRIAHKISPQSLPNSHRIAAKYGNAIGKFLTERNISNKV